MGIIDKLTNFVDWVSEWSGRIFSLLVYPLIFVVCMSVFYRYALTKSIAWSFDMTWMLYGALTFLGGAYTFKHGGHAKVDVLLSYLSEKKQNVVTIICYFVFFMPAFIALTYSMYGALVRSLASMERSAASAWRPLMWPMRAVMLVSLGLMLVQGTLYLINHIRDLKQEG